MRGGRGGRGAREEGRAGGREGGGGRERERRESSDRTRWSHSRARERDIYIYIYMEMVGEREGGKEGREGRQGGSERWLCEQTQKQSSQKQSVCVKRHGDGTGISP